MIAALDFTRRPRIMTDEYVQTLKQHSEQFNSRVFNV